MIPTAHLRQQHKRRLDQFSRIRTVSLFFTRGHLSPSKLPLPMGGSGPPSNTWFLGPTRVHNPNGISIGSAVFAGLTSVTDRPTDRQTDRPTDHATRSVTIGRIYVLQCGQVIIPPAIADVFVGRNASASSSGRTEVVAETVAVVTEITITKPSRHRI